MATFLVNWAESLEIEDESSLLFGETDFQNDLSDSLNSITNFNLNKLESSDSLNDNKQQIVTNSKLETSLLSSSVSSSLDLRSPKKGTIDSLEEQVRVLNAEIVRLREQGKLLPLFDRLNNDTRYLIKERDQELRMIKLENQKLKEERKETSNKMTELQKQQQKFRRENEELRLALAYRRKNPRKNSEFVT